MAALKDNLARSFANGPVVTSPADDDDAHVLAEKCTPKQEAFALAWAQTGNKMAAYRMAYNVRERTLPNVVWVNACRVANLPQVIARYKVLVQQAALETIMDVRQAFAWLIDIATADPTELSWVVARNCRYCRGFNHEFQWKDENEYLAACIKALDAKEMPPSDIGGYGFNGALEPTGTCSHCFGVGHRESVVADTSTLKGKARKLYAGAKMDRFGAIEIKMHDQKAAWEMALRILGAFNDKLDIRTPEERARAEDRMKMPENVTAEQAAKAYLQLIN